MISVRETGKGGGVQKAISIQITYIESKMDGEEQLFNFSTLLADRDIFTTFVLRFFDSIQKKREEKSFYLKIRKRKFKVNQVEMN